MIDYTQRILEEFIEKGADLEHDRWSRWHKYSRLVATPANIEMWDRKAEMPYLALTNEEQESDRKETRKYLPLLEDSIAQAVAEERERVVTEDTSDGYHTFKELYEHRITLYIALCKSLNNGNVWRSKLHSDSSSFDGWFILGIWREKGKQISYHLPNERWREGIDSRSY